MMPIHFKEPKTLSYRLTLKLPKGSFGKLQLEPKLLPLSGHVAPKDSSPDNVCLH